MQGGLKSIGTFRTVLAQLTGSTFKSDVHRPLDQCTITIRKPLVFIVLMAVVNSEYEFIMADVGVNGRVSDGCVFSHTTFGQKLQDQSLHLPEPACLPNSIRQVPYVLVGDDAFGLCENLLKPYNRADLNNPKRIFNYRLSRARRIVENAFGILTARFGVFQRLAISVSPEKAQCIVLACCYLHNYLRRGRSNAYIDPGSVDIEFLETGHIHEGSWRSVRQLLELESTRARNASQDAKVVLESYCEYFNSEAKVPWQDRHVI